MLSTKLFQLKVALKEFIRSWPLKLHSDGTKPVAWSQPNGKNMSAILLYAVDVTVYFQPLIVTE